MVFSEKKFNEKFIFYGDDYNEKSALRKTMLDAARWGYAQGIEEQKARDARLREKVTSIRKRVACVFSPLADNIRKDCDEIAVLLEGELK